MFCKNNLVPAVIVAIAVVALIWAAANQPESHSAAAIERPVPAAPEATAGATAKTITIVKPEPKGPVERTVWTFGTTRLSSATGRVAQLSYSRGVINNYTIITFEDGEPLVLCSIYPVPFARVRITGVSNSTSPKEFGSVREITRLD